MINCRSERAEKERALISGKLHIARRFQDTVVLITGGSGALGNEFVRTLSQEGARVAFTYLNNESAARDLVCELGEDRVTRFKADVCDLRSAKNIVGETISRWGTVNILINNASLMRDGLLLGTDDDEWQRVIATSIIGAYSYTKPAVSHMLRAGGGTILNIGSVSAVKGVRGQSSYCTAKAGLLGMTRALAVELAPHNIRVNAVLPGMLDSGLGRSVPPARIEAIRSHIPMKRLGRAAEIVKVGLFLLSEEASYMTGQCIAVDGGLTAT
jgi:3-oxoacyl-[acyl-carrier protein] reductase